MGRISPPRLTMRYPDACLQIFSKAPIPGEVKTRLIPTLGEENAADLHRRLTERQIIEAVSADLVPVQLWCAPDCSHEFFRYCERVYGTSLHAQQGADLGERMYRSLEAGLRDFRYAVLIGSDIPSLDAMVLLQAFSALEEGGDAVFVPAEDGGYGLIGLRRNHRSLFEGIDWGSDGVMAQTRERLRALGWDWSELDPCWDLDRPEDLARLRMQGARQVD